MRYAAIIKTEGKATLAEFPDAPGCQTFAEPDQDIAEMALDALKGWLEAHLIDDDVPPHPGIRAPRVRAGESVLWVDVPVKLALQLELRSARKAAKLSQAALARLAGVSQQAIAKLEDPDANPTIETLDKVARALGTRLQVSLAAAQHSVS